MNPKLCIDCFWCDTNFDHFEEWVCHRGVPETVDPLTGVMGWQNDQLLPCRALRRMKLDSPNDAELCNIDGRHWKSKEPAEDLLANSVICNPDYTPTGGTCPTCGGPT